MKISVEEALVPVVDFGIPEVFLSFFWTLSDNRTSKRFQNVVFEAQKLTEGDFWAKIFLDKCMGNHFLGGQCYYVVLAYYMI